jgi:hypothetical protein
MIDGFLKLLTGLRPTRGFAKKILKIDNLASISPSSHIYIISFQPFFEKNQMT